MLQKIPVLVKIIIGEYTPLFKSNHNSKFDYEIVYCTSQSCMCTLPHGLNVVQCDNSDSDSDENLTGMSDKYMNDFIMGKKLKLRILFAS